MKWLPEKVGAMCLENAVVVFTEFNPVWLTWFLENWKGNRTCPSFAAGPDSDSDWRWVFDNDGTMIAWDRRRLDFLESDETPTYDSRHQIHRNGDRSSYRAPLAEIHQGQIRHP